MPHDSRCGCVFCPDCSTTTTPMTAEAAAAAAAAAGDDQAAAVHAAAAAEAAEAAQARRSSHRFGGEGSGGNVAMEAPLGPAMVFVSTPVPCALCDGTCVVCRGIIPPGGLALE